MEIIDLKPLLRDLAQQIAQAGQEGRAIEIKLARLHGLRDGVLLAIEQANRPIMTHGKALPLEGGQVHDV